MKPKSTAILSTFQTFQVLDRLRSFLTKQFSNRDEWLFLTQYTIEKNALFSAWSIQGFVLLVAQFSRTLDPSRSPILEVFPAPATKHKSKSSVAVLHTTDGCLHDPNKDLRNSASTLLFMHHPRKLLPATFPNSYFADNARAQTSANNSLPETPEGRQKRITRLV